MQVKLEKLDSTNFKLTITADAEMLQDVKREALEHLGRSHVKLQGFRKGKAPVELVEKSIDPAALQTEFLDRAVNKLYVTAVEQRRLRPIAQPSVSITKFVPYTTLEISATVEGIGEIKLPDYKKIKMAPNKVAITTQDVDDVLKNLKIRAASRNDVTRASQDGDEIWIDFTGVDTTTRKPIQGADGTDYPLILGSNTFIPGFEKNLVGMKPEGSKEFTLTFPKDYGVKALQNKKVTFNVTIKKIQEIIEPELNDDFASTVGPFKTVEELKADIKKQLLAEKQAQADREYENKLLEEIAKKSLVAVPKSLVDEEIERIEQEERQSIMYRGQTWQEHLDEEGVSAEEHKERNRSGAEIRVKAGLVLGELAEAENLKITPEELEMQLQLLKGQYNDAAMQSELDKPENVRDIASRMLTEKTLAKVKRYAQQA
ncbi:MAG TPA: trigger factor [Candidatus Saccharimonadales bacterium]|nr:trigger factor [Candidatus Saccharimonadales bacterium]